MRISGVCLLISTFCLAMAGYARLATGAHWHPSTISMLVLLTEAMSCLGALELKIHRRTRWKQQQHASTLAAALRSGALR